MGASCSPLRSRVMLPVSKTSMQASFWIASCKYRIVPGLSAAGETSGMQTTVVKPPAAAARVPEAIVSRPPPPSSRRCARRSINPGATIFPDASTTFATSLSLAAGASQIRPSATYRSATSSRPLAGSIIRPFFIQIASLMTEPLFAEGRLRWNKGRVSPFERQFRW